MEHHYLNSLSERLLYISMSDKSLSALVRQMGSNRPVNSAFMKQFTAEYIEDTAFLLLDATQILPLSATVDYAPIGYNSKGSHDPQV